VDKLIIQASENTPRVLFDPGAARYECRGRSFPDDTLSFYEPILTWFGNFAESQNIKGSLDIYFDYYNTGTYIRLMEMFDLLEKLNKKGHDLSIHWYVEEDDEDSMENGKALKEVVNVPFDLRTFPSISFQGDQ
jgi:hypothetical protein